MGHGRLMSAVALVLTGALSAGLGGSASAHGRARADAWYQTGYNQGHAGLNPGERTLAPSTVGRLAPGWTLHTGSLHSIPGTTTARLAPGAAYLVADDDAVYAVDSATGRRRWTTHLTDTSPLQQPVLHLGVLVVAAGCCTTSSRSLVGLDAVTGRRLWSRAIEPLSLWSAAGGSIYLGAYPDGHSPSLTRLDVRTGRQLWTVTSSDPGDFGWDQTALDGTLLVAQHLHGFRASAVEARRTTDARVVWQSRLPAPSPVAHGVVIAGHTVYVAYFGRQAERLRALTESGQVRWDIRVGSASQCANLNEERPSVSGALVLLPCGGTMSAYDAASGHRRWTTRLGDYVTDAAIANGVWFAGWSDYASATNRLGAFRLTDGRTLWQAATAQSSTDLVREEGPSVAEGRVYWSFGTSTLRTFAVP